MIGSLGFRLQFLLCWSSSFIACRLSLSSVASLYQAGSTPKSTCTRYTVATTVRWPAAACRRVSLSALLHQVHRVRNPRPRSDTVHCALVTTSKTTSAVLSSLAYNAPASPPLPSEKLLRTRSILCLLWYIQDSAALLKDLSCMHVLHMRIQSLRFGRLLVPVLLFLQPSFLPIFICKSELLHLDVRPGSIVLLSIDNVMQDVPVGYENDTLLWSRTQQVANILGTSL